MLCVLSCAAILVESFKDKPPMRILGLTSDEPDLLVFEFELSDTKYNYAIDVLLHHSAAFNLHISGDNTVEGTRYSRYSSKGRHLDFFVRDDEIDPKLSNLMKLLHTPEDLVKMISDHHKRTVPLPWTDQEQFGKIHRTLNLIKPI
jgi:hypothetical protein